MIDEVAIYNMALSSIGTRAVIAATDEGSPEAQELNIWYETVRDRILGSAFWPSTKATFRLNLLASRDQDTTWSNGDPLPGWQYAYGRPSDMLRPRYLTTFAQFEQGLRDANTPAIFTNDPNSILVYTARQVNPGLWDSDLQFAVAHALGSVACMKLTGNKAKRDTAWQIAYDLVLQARVATANDQQRTLDFTPSAMLARGYTDLTGASTPFIFPYAEVYPTGFGNVS
jgi:hypothetical protein